MGGKVNKAEVVAQMSKISGLSKSDTEKALSAFTATIKKTLKKGNKVVLVGFGTFSVSKRKARTGRNPQTGAAIKIAARNVPKFSSGKALKDAVR